MKQLIIIHEDGCAPRTDNITLANADTHIAARDRYADEAAILKAYHHEASGEPLAWKRPQLKDGSGRFLYSESKVSEIEAADPSLIVRITVVEEGVKAYFRGEAIH